MANEENIKKRTYRDNHFNQMPNLSQKGLIMERELKILADQYGYKKLPKELSETQRQHYINELDDFWKNKEFEGKEVRLTTSDGTVLATGVSERGFVCGDYGVFLEIETSQIVMENIQIQQGEEYRVNDPRYANNVKYQWFTDKSGDNVKLYYQQKGVTYADYKPGKWYISPYEVNVEIAKEKETPSLFGVKEGIICQQVNCCGVMGAGLAKAIISKFPQVKEEYDEFYRSTTNVDNKNYLCHFNQLGASMLIALDNKPVGESNLMVANIYSQDFYGNPAKSGKIYTKLNILTEIIEKIAKNNPAIPVYVPKGIGCGYGGEVWERVYPELQRIAEKCENLYVLDTRSCEVERLLPKDKDSEIENELESDSCEYSFD